MKALEKLMFWRKRQKSEPPEPAPDPRPSDPLTTESRPESSDEKEHREERQRPKGGESAFRAKLFEEPERKAEEREPPEHATP